MLYQRLDYKARSRLIHFFLLQITWDVVLSQLHYIIPEESKHGTFVGRIAQDLGLDIGEINSRMLHIVSRDEKEYFQVIVDKPVQMYRVDVEIEDINDNSPVFPSNVYNHVISEVKHAGSRFQLEEAADPDLGTNSITNYELSASEYFALDYQKYLNQIKSLELVLKKNLDREKQSVHNLTLTAYDGGKPRLSGTTHIIVNVEDFNDNAPVFDQPFYQCSVNENAVEGTLVFKLNATDLDEGRNGEIIYEFSNMVSGEAFTLDKNTGEIRVKGKLDFESVNMYKLQVKAVDYGDVQQVGHCKVLVTVVDVNDNPPEMTVTSLSVPVPENSPQGTTVAIISVHDKDSGSNGKVHCYITEPSPFKVNPAFMSDFSLTVNGPLDREVKDEYEVTITVRDEGSPSLSTSKTLKIDISDTNDNAPRFIQPVDTVFIKENNPPGSHIYTASAFDPDIGQNSFITYSIQERTIEGIPLSSYISINPENGKVFALVSFDHEQISYFQCHIKATDAGLQTLSSNLTLNIFIEDINDNAPTFTPLHSELTIKAPKSAEPGHLITKVKAVDLDSGYNAWTFYKLKDFGGSGKSPFTIAHQTGEITLKRSFTDSDSDEYRLHVVAQDHGEPVMTAEAQIVVSVVESGEELKFDNQETKVTGDEFSDENIYLVVAICVISSIFLITLIVFTVLRWQKYRDEVNELKENYRICSNTGGSWMYSQHTQYNISSNSVRPKSDLIVFTPNNSQTLGNEEQVNPQGVMSNSYYKKVM
ncbi:protocadherin alpha-6-like [Leptodactylus fuscus]|uniref:protocadherin alpha-6-like n=1 Tax=Leptodactylus fuscus TaxID=238119 RepID=UPI003F4EB208